MDVRRLGPEDWELFRDVRLLALADSPGAFGSSLERERAYTEQHWRDWMAPDRGLKAVVDGTAGVVGVWRPEDREAELYSMWVDPASRGRGVADALLHEALRWAREQELGSVDLWVVGDNERARRLYERHGFRRTGEEQPYPRDPSLVEYVMRRTL
ncbi:GNAT family N-acetyltransferase [Dactylosporangium sp. CS-033363]|uniref:GNAT family N-acetyltransferase n=1 Tax=Dactylosporangium sp. CS-033363 TaxID=3239935 RepID=UPI003D8B2817